MIQAFTFWDTKAKQHRVRFTDDGKLLFIIDLADFMKLPAVSYVMELAVERSRAPSL